MSEHDLIPIIAIDPEPPPPVLGAARFGSALDAVGAVPPPQTPPANPIPAYSLQAGGDGITVRDVKAAGFGALIIVVLGAVVSMFRRPMGGRRDVW